MIILGGAKVALRGYHGWELIPGLSFLADLWEANGLWMGCPRAEQEDVKGSCPISQQQKSTSLMLMPRCSLLKPHLCAS